MGFDALASQNRLKLRGRAAAILQCDDITGLAEIGGNIDLLAIDLKVPMTHELARLRTGHGEPKAIHNIIKAALEDHEQILARNALTLLSKLKVMGELSLEDAIKSLGLLLLTKLRAILTALFTRLAVLARSKVAADDRALAGIASIALQKELFTLAAAICKPHRYILPFSVHLLID